MIRRLLKKYRGILLYGVFGVMTTVINLIVYLLLYEYVGVPNTVSNVIAWVLAVLFAYITNKIWVFQSRSFRPEDIFPEFQKFIGCRVATGFIDLAIMLVSVDIVHGSATLWKIISNIIVIILNYAASKIIIFKQC